MTFHIITLFPKLFDSFLRETIIARAVAEGKMTASRYYLRDFNDEAKKRIDAKPYGGGPGMVMRAMPIVQAVEAIKKKSPKAKVYIMSPRGKVLDNKLAQKLSKEKDVVLICGRYEGIDARVKKILKATEISVGPYTLSGGEVPAMIVIDAVTRRLPGVLGDPDSIEEKRNASGEVYTRPEIIDHKGKKYRVPKILLSGHHRDIETWREKKNKRSK